MHLPEVTFPRKLSFQNLHSPESTFSRNYISPKTHFPKFLHFTEFTFSRNYISPKNYFPEFTLARIYISPKLHLPENSFSRNYAYRVLVISFRKMIFHLVKFTLRKIYWLIYFPLLTLKLRVGYMIGRGRHSGRSRDVVGRTPKLFF